MDETFTNQSGTGRLPLKRGYKIDYKEKLGRTPAGERTDGFLDTIQEDRLPPYADQIRTLARHADAESLTFQCVAVTALQTLDRVSYREGRAAEAAISLAQQEKLQHMTATVKDILTALRQTLTAQGNTMLQQHPPASGHDETPEPLWWFALSEALQVLAEGRDWMHSIMAGQPRGSLAYTLSGIVTALLHAHYLILFEEAEQWMA